MPEDTLSHFADHGDVGSVLPRDGERASETLSAIAKAGVDLDALAADLQSEGAKSFDEFLGRSAESDRDEIQSADLTTVGGVAVAPGKSRIWTARIFLSVELRGYHIYGDPWREQRYTND